MKKPSQIRNYVLLTFSHGELPHRMSICRERIRKRLLTIFPPSSQLIISTERHKGGGFHYHVGLLTYISKNGLKEKLKTAFPEWEGQSFHIAFKKGWASLCSYLSKEDDNFLVWGVTRREVFDLAWQFKNHKKRKAFSGRKAKKKAETRSSLQPKTKTKTKTKTPGQKSQLKPRRTSYRYDLKRMFLYAIVFQTVSAFLRWVFSPPIQQQISSFFPIQQQISSFFFPSPEPSLLSQLRDWWFPAPPPPLAPWEIFFFSLIEPAGLDFYDLVITLL